MTHIYKLFLGLMMLFCAVNAAHASDQKRPLSLSEVLTLAELSTDPSVAVYLSKSAEQRDLSVAASQLPDPKIRFGVNNLAADSFSLTQEPMTSIQLAVHQSFKSPLKRRLAGQEGLERSKASIYAAQNREAELRRTVEKIYAQLVYSFALEYLVEQKKTVIDNSIKSYENRIKNADNKLQMVLDMQAELALFDDKLAEIQQQRDQLQAYLSRYIGEQHSKRVPADDYMIFRAPKPLQMIESNLRDHPALLINRAMIKANERAIALAKENYKPDWGFDVGYGRRGAGRADLATAMVTMSVPLFTERRQDKKLSAAKRAKQSTMLDQRAKELEMMKSARANFTLWQKTGERIDLYKKIILARTRAATQSYQNAFTDGRGDFTDFIRSHLSELNARVKLEQIKLERANATIELNYYAAGSEGADK